MPVDWSLSFSTAIDSSQSVTELAAKQPCADVGVTQRGALPGNACASPHAARLPGLLSSCAQCQHFIPDLRNQIVKFPAHFYLPVPVNLPPLRDESEHGEHRLIDPPQFSRGLTAIQ